MGLSPSERDRIADERDQRADERDRQADQRDRQADERERNAAASAAIETASQEQPPAVDDGLFGIDLGSKVPRTQAVEPEPNAAPNPPRPVAKTLTERLAEAQADRDRAGPPADRDS